MILVKLGGSILTNKGTSGAPRFNRQLSRRIVRELRRVTRKESLVLVHGAGSWGHPLALRYQIGRRKLSGARLQDAVVETQAGVRALRHLVVAECVAAGLPAVDVPASAIAFGRGKETYLDAALVGLYADQGLVPVIGGDVILDATLGARILSGDEILASLAGALKPKRAVLVTDVDGLRVDGRTQARLTLEAARKLLPRIQAGGDATGGMRGKLEHAIHIASLGVPVTMVNGRRPGRIEAACLGRRVVGTRLG